MLIRLCSSSQTRAMLLEEAKIDFIQESVEFDEECVVASSPKNFVYQATLGKYEANLKAFGYEEYPLLVADTVVTSQGHILRKARCEDDARNILMTQSGNITSIITCMIYHAKEKKIIDISQTDYIFDDFNQNDLDNKTKVVVIGKVVEVANNNELKRTIILLQVWNFNKIKKVEKSPPFLPQILP